MAVLQGWSHNNFGQRVTGLAFVITFGVAAAWGLKTLFAAVHR